MTTSRVGVLLLLAACGDASASGLSSNAGFTGEPDGGAPASSGSSMAPDAGMDSGSPPAARADATPGLEASTAEGGALPCTGLPLCDGFEGDSPGVAPAGWSVVMGCNPNTQDTAVDGGGLLVGVDAARHHGGQHSLRVVGGDSCGFYAVQESALATLGPQLYARFWVLFSASPSQNHNGFLSMATKAGDHLRLGFQDAVLAWNAQLSDATLPDMDPQGTTQSAATQADLWSCLEFHVDETNGHIEFWKDGQPVAGLGYDGTSQQGVNDQWSRGGPSPAVPTSLALGWLGLNEQQTVWFDDVALGSARIGCH